MEHCRTALGRVYVRVGDALVTNHRTPLVEIFEDSSDEVNDFLIACCDHHRYQQYDPEQFVQDGDGTGVVRDRIPCAHHLSDIVDRSADDETDLPGVEPQDKNEYRIKDHGQRRQCGRGQDAERKLACPVRIWRKNRCYRQRGRCAADRRGAADKDAEAARHFQGPSRKIEMEGVAAVAAITKAAMGMPGDITEAGPI